MYFIGPLLFWACAEMTCGFLIFSVPSMPRILKAAFRGTAAVRSAYRPPQPTSSDYSRGRRRRWAKPSTMTTTVTESGWTQIDEGEIALTAIGPAQQQQSEMEGSSRATSVQQRDADSSRDSVTLVA